MYRPRSFRRDDSDALFAFIAERAFGVISGADSVGPVAAHVPLQVIPAAGPHPARLHCHVARANPLVRIAATGGRLLAVVGGPDAYVSPDWYRTPNQVPTWNYIAVHATGRARLLTPTELTRHIEGLSDAQEARLRPKPPWTLDKLDPARLDGLLRAIIGLEIAIDSLEGTWKLSQNKTPADRDGVIRGLESLDAQQYPQASSVARAMRDDS